MTCTPDVFQGLNRRRRQRPQGNGSASCGALAEPLEARRLFSVSVFHNTTTNILQITGDANDNVIRVYQLTGSPNQIKVYVQGQTPDSGPYNVNADLTLVKVFAGGGADDVQFGSDTYGYLGSLGGQTAVSVPAEIHGDAGNDANLIGTDSPDTIWGDAGNDTLWGADGNDIMYGGYGGQDQLHGDAGNDIVYGGDGGAGGNVEVEADMLWGGVGNDTLYGEGGNDEIRPDGGVDVAYGGAGDDTFRSSWDNEFDWLDGGSGTDNAGTSGVDYDAATDSLVSFP